MIGVALRQHRIQLSSGAALMIILAVLLVWTGHEMTSYLHSTGLAGCLAAHGGGCDSFSQLFENRYGSLLKNTAYLNFLPMLVGIFWGAPLVARELETGTYRLAWTQSITRRRWLTTKLAIFVVATVGIGAIFSLLLSWWFHPFAQLQFQGGYSRMPRYYSPPPTTGTSLDRIATEVDCPRRPERATQMNETHRRERVEE